MASELANVTPAELDERIANSPGLLVVYLWGPDCPNCVIFKRCLPKLLAALTDVNVDFVAVDVYEHAEVGRRFGVFGIPHFVLFKGGKKLGKMSEFRGESYWLSVVREHAA